MPTFHLPWRRPGKSKGQIAGDEATLHEAHETKSNDDWLSVLSNADDQLKDDPILGLVGNASEETTLEFMRADKPEQPAAQTSAQESVPAPAPSKELIDSLQRQYWRALADPHDVLMGSWGWQASEADHAPMIEASEQGWQPPKASSQYESIEALLSGQHTLEDAFGQMTPGHDEVSIEPVPEVLRLFAPLEYHAAEGRRPAPLPPAFNRREHHTLSVDSAFAAPDRTENQEPQESA